MVTAAKQQDFYEGITIIASDYGLLAASLYLIGFGVIAFIGLCSSRKQPDPTLRTLGLLTSFGLAAWVCLASAWSLGLSPWNGISLPFTGNVFADILGALAAGIIFRLARSKSEKMLWNPGRPLALIAAAILCLLLVTMWTMTPPFIPSIQEDEVTD